MSRNKTIRSKLFNSYAYFIVGLLLMFILFFFFYVTNLLRDRAADAIAQTCTSIQKQTDLEIDALNTLSLNISYSVLLKEAFQSHVNPNDASSNVDKLTAIDTLDTIYELIIAIIGPNSTAKQINLYDFEGQMIGGGTKNVIVDKNLEEMFWFDETIAKKWCKIYKQSL